jgi:hypothetical protein
MSALVKTLVAAGLAGASLLASAQSIAPRHGADTAAEIDQRQARQAQRIERGVLRGDLTRREARELRQDQREIRRLEARALADGRLDWREARHLTALLDAADARIRELRRDHDPRYDRDMRRDGESAVDGELRYDRDLRRDPSRTTYRG